MKRTLDQLIDLLYALDDLLEKKKGDPKISACLPLNIDALGGAAALYWHVRVNNLTSDIDSFCEIPDNLMGVIRAVNADNWVNSQILSVSGARLYLVGLEFDDSEWEFRNIRLRFADMKSLLKSKLFALYNAAKEGFDYASTPFRQDVDDVKNALRIMDIKDKSALDKGFYGFAFEERWPKADSWVDPRLFDRYGKVDLFDRFRLFER